VAAKLIFFSTVGPDHDDGAWFPFNQARRAADAGLDVEIFLAGPATGLFRSASRSGLEGRAKDSLAAIGEARVPIQFSPG
jgi:predicted peroxiredoxin